jgi:hypothetical protein
VGVLVFRLPTCFEASDTPSGKAHVSLFRSPTDSEASDTAMAPKVGLAHVPPTGEFRGKQHPPQTRQRLPNEKVNGFRERKEVSGRV